MKLLLYTHTFIWWDSEPHKLSPKVMTCLNDARNLILLSVASIWEMQIKRQLGKLTLRLPLTEILQAQQQNGLEILPIVAAHVFLLDELPLHHNDPFDRLLAAQSICEAAMLISDDKKLAHYPVDLLW
jgi:PIN domain nuclease of toxin-antitoxin system